MTLHLSLALFLLAGPPDAGPPGADRVAALPAGGCAGAPEVKVPGRNPRFLPGSDAVVFETGPAGAADLHVLHLATGSVRPLVTGPGDDCDGSYISLMDDHGKILYERRGGAARPTLPHLEAALLAHPRWAGRVGAGELLDDLAERMSGVPVRGANEVFGYPGMQPYLMPTPPGRGRGHACGAHPPPGAHEGVAYAPGRVRSHGQRLSRRVGEALAPGSRIMAGELPPRPDWAEHYLQEDAE